MTDTPRPCCAQTIERAAKDRDAAIFERGWKCGQFAQGRPDAGDWLDFWCSDEQADLRRSLPIEPVSEDDVERVVYRAVRNSMANGEGPQEVARAAIAAMGGKNAE